MAAGATRSSLLRRAAALLIEQTTCVLDCAGGLWE
jgi:hypothetical protein